MKIRSAIVLGVKIVDIALQVARGQKNINDMGESGRYCDRISVVLVAITISRRFDAVFEGRGVRFVGLGSSLEATTQQSTLALKW